MTTDDDAVYVRLTQLEAQIAVLIGSSRRVCALRNGQRGGYGDENRDTWGQWGADIEAAATELAVAKYMQWWWDTELTPSKMRGDVNGVEVRATRWPNGRLIFRNDDAPDRAYVLVTGAMPDYCLRGWIRGEDACDEHYWDDAARADRAAAYFVPAAALHPIDELRDYLALRDMHADRSAHGDH